MKTYLLLTLFALSSYTIHAQSDLEYSTIHAIVYADGSSIVYDESGTIKTPVIYLPDGTSGVFYNEVKSEKKKFKSVNEIINYMSEFKWKLKEFDTVNEPDRIVHIVKNDSVSDDSINIKQYVSIMIFERGVK